MSSINRRSLWACLLAAGLLATVAHAADKDPLLSDPKVRKAVEAVATADKTAIKDCLAKLKKAKKDAMVQLEDGRKVKMKDGKLDEALAMKKHAEAFEAELKASQYFNDEDSTSKSAEEQTVCEVLTKAQKEAEDLCREARIEARKPLLAMLTEMQEVATKADKLDQAVALKARVDGVAEQIEELKSSGDAPSGEKWKDVQPCSFLKHRVVFGEVVSKEAKAKQSSVYDGLMVKKRLFKGELGNATEAFHTNGEKIPWLAMDLGQEQEMTGIFVKNRPQTHSGARAKTLQILVSSDMRNWRTIWRNTADPVPDSWEIPLMADPVKARYLRFELRDTELQCLHLRRIEVWSRDGMTPLPVKTDGAIAPAKDKPIFGK